MNDYLNTKITLNVLYYVNVHYYYDTARYRVIEVYKHNGSVQTQWKCTNTMEAEFSARS